jgi:putative spermidine/putrescine transport system ATP-binding protein
VTGRIETLRFRLTKRFGARTVLDDFGLEARGREFITLLGPSGCGKSTALNLLAGLLVPTAGEIWVDGVRIDGLPPERRGFGMVFQNYALFPHLTVFDNAAFGLVLRGVPRREIGERVARMLKLVQLPGLEGRYPSQLSGGQQQRVALARALVVEPRLLLLDEPLSNLDAKLRVEMRAEIKRLHVGLGLTSIYVTHDQAEALSLSDRIVVMREGRVMQAGPPADIHDRPQNLFVADFMGYRNFFPVTIAERRPGGLVVGKADALTLIGRTTGELAPGAAAMAAVRPEDVVLTGDRAGDNVVRGRVRLTEYLGREHDVEVALDGGGTVRARVTAAPKAGDVVGLRLPAERVVVLPSEIER